MVIWDYVVLLVYFATMIAVGVYSSRLIKGQSDYFLGGRSFGKLLQTFAAFGAGTGSSDPVNAARTTFTSGMSGMWSVMYWLLVTPFYWITAVWYRRMRHLTLGDWFVERYNSRALGAGYCVFGLLFYMIYGSMMFSAIGKVAAPVIGYEWITIGGQSYPIEYVLVPVIGIVVLVYGVIGGLHAAYYTDLIQGLCIILLSVMLIPFGLMALVEKFGDPSADGMLAGFTYMHQQLPESHFHLVGSTSSSEFPLHRIVAVVMLNLIGIVVQPHFIATGGGSAKTEQTARVGLVAGNFLKRLCTVGWALTALIALALYANNPELSIDPDKTWGVASRELLGPGLTGLMLACLLAALMSSVDAYMIVGSALVVRNLYTPYVNPTASEVECIRLARWTGAVIVGGAVGLSLVYLDVFQQLQITWVFNILFAAPFWIGLYWRRATLSGAWATVAFSVFAFFLLPSIIPRVFANMRTNPSFCALNRIVETTTTRRVAPTDVEQREASIAAWEQRRQQILSERLEAAAEQAALDKIGPRPIRLEIGQTMSIVEKSGGQSVYWSGGLTAIDDQGRPAPHIRPVPTGPPQKIDENLSQTTFAYPMGTRLRGSGSFRIDFLIYDWMGVDLTSKSNAVLNTLELPLKIVAPFLVMILVSLLTRCPPTDVVNRYYAKMRTPVDPHPDIDRKNLEAAYANAAAMEHLKLFPGTQIEIQKPNLNDILGFIICWIVCIAVIGIAVLVANIGG